MADKFTSSVPGLESPIENAAAVTPNDSTDLTNYSRALWVGGAGDVVVITVGGNTVTFVGVTAGTLLPVRCSRVKSTSTTATSILALW